MFILFFRRLPRSILFPYTTLFRSLGLAYWIAGVPSPALLGAVTGFMALIPGGAPLSFTLVSIYLLSSGKIMAGGGVFLWVCIHLFIFGKTLVPRLVGGPVRLPLWPAF